MPDPLLPPEVRQFILDYVDNIMEMEALLLLRANPDDKWSTGTIAKRLYISEPDARKVALQMTKRGFFSQTGTPPLFQYSASEEKNALISEVAEVYSRCLIPVTSLIHSKPKTRIREFANAFMVRKDRNDG